MKHKKLIKDGNWYKSFKYVVPNHGAVYADKGYCDKNTKIIAQTKNLHLAAVKKNNMKNKNRDLDSYYTKLKIYTPIKTLSKHSLKF